MSIYSSLTTTGAPNALIGGQGGISATTTGLKTFSFSPGVALTAGTIYWLALLAYGHSTTMTFSGIGTSAVLTFHTVSTADFTGVAMYTQAGSFTFLPPTATATASNATLYPLIILEK